MRSLLQGSPGCHILVMHAFSCPGELPSSRSIGRSIPNVQILKVFCGTGCVFGSSCREACGGQGLEGGVFPELPNVRSKSQFPPSTHPDQRTELLPFFSHLSIMIPPWWCIVGLLRGSAVQKTNLGHRSKLIMYCQGPDHCQQAGIGRGNRLRPITLTMLG